MTKKAELALPETKDIDDRDSTIKQKVFIFYGPSTKLKDYEMKNCT